MNQTKPSKLLLYLKILDALEKQKTTKLLDLQGHVRVDNALLEKALSFLEQQDLVRKESIENKTVYASTPRGNRITKYFILQTQDSTELSCLMSTKLTE